MSENLVGEISIVGNDKVTKKKGIIKFLTREQTCNRGNREGT